MPARKRKYTQTDTGAWAGDSGGINVAIERNGVLTRIDMTAEITPSATLAGANMPDGLFRVFQNTTIRGGSHTYVTLPAQDPCGGGILMHYLNRKDFRMVGHGRATIVAPSRTYNPITFRYHFGSRPQTLFGIDNPFDMSAFIPANKESSLSFVITTSGNDVMDDTVTISSGTYRFELSIIQGTEGDIREEIGLQGVQYPPSAPMGMVPAWIAELFSHTATGSDYSVKRDLQTGGWLKRIAIIEQDETATRAVRAHDQVTGVSIDLSSQNEQLIRSFMDSYFNSQDASTNTVTNDTAPEFQGGYAAHGIIILDMRSHARGHSDYGLDLRALQTGQVKLGLTITTYTSGDASLILQERYMANPFQSLSGL